MSTMSAEKKKVSIEIGSDIWDSIKSTGSWVGGALKGEFNDKATFGQIVFDAVISMFPVAGEATAVRDLIAIVNRMSGNEKEAQKVLNWVGIILCLLPVIPVFGGILKGIGRLLISVIKDATKIGKVATEILAFLRKMGYGDPIKFIDSLKFSKYQAKILSEFKKFIGRLKASIQFFIKKMGAVLPKDVQIQLNSSLPELDKLAKLADKMIPSAIKELDRALNLVRSEMINQMNKAGTKIGGGQTKVMTKEARLASSASKTIASKGHKPAPLNHFKPAQGYPDLSNPKLSWIIRTFSVQRRIRPKTYSPGSKVNLTRVLDKGDPKPKGLFWGDILPKNGTEWRFDCAVLSSWSDNGVYVQLTKIPTIKELDKMGISVPPNWKGLKVWEGAIAEQIDFEKGIGSKLLLPGGGTQIIIDFYHVDNIPIARYIDKIIKIQNTNWKDAILPKDTSTTVQYLLNREVSKKVVQQGQVTRITSSTGRANSKENK